MGVKIYGFRPNRSLTRMLEHIKADYQSHKNIVLIVPEHYSLEAHKNLLNQLQLTGFFNIHILTPSYLSSQLIEKSVTKYNNVLGSAGEAVALSIIVEKLGDELLYYKDCFSQKGVYLELIDFLSDLMRNDISVQNIENYLDSLSSSQQRIKWQDILLIYKEYLTFFAERFINTVTLPKYAAEAILESPYFEDTVVYLYGFDHIRESLRDVLVAIAQRAEQLNIYANLQGRSAMDYALYIPMEKSINTLLDCLLQAKVPCSIELFADGLDRPEPFQHIDRTLYCKPSPDIAQNYPKKQDNIIIFNGDSPYEEIKFVCRKVNELVENDVPFHKIALLLPERNDYAFILYSELLSMGIPFHNNEELRLAEHPLIKYFLQIVRYLGNKHHPDYIEALLHNPSCPLSHEELAFLNNYSFQNGITPGLWLKPFTRSKKQAERAESLRRKLIDPLLFLETELSDAKDFYSMVQAFLIFLQSNHFFEHLRADEAQLMKYGLYSSADYNRKLLESMVEVFRQLQAVLNNQKVPLHKLADYLEYAFHEAGISALPPIDDSLPISTLSRVLLSDIDYLFVLGFHEDVLASGDSSLFQHNELSAFEYSCNVRIQISPEDLDLRNRQHIKKAFTMPRQKLYISYSKTNFDGKSLWPFSALAELENRFFKDNLIYEQLPMRRYEEHISKRMRELRSLFSYYLSADQEEKNALLPKLAALVQGFQAEGFEREDIKQALGGKAQARIRSTTAKQLFKANTVTVSRLEQYARCPFKHFVDYGIKPDKNEKWEAKASDIGTFYHAVFENLFDRLKNVEDLASLRDQDIENMMEDIIDNSELFQSEGPYTDNPVGLARLKNMRSNIKQAGKILCDFSRQSKFRTLATEYRFDEYSNIPFLISLDDGSAITLRGSIDRLDTYKSDSARYMRIIDYKSSHKELKASELWHGSQLQLLLYLNVVLKHFKGAKPSGAFYFHIDNPWINTMESSSAQVYANQLKDLRLDGVLLKDHESILALDIDAENPISIAKCLNKDGSFSKRDKLLSEDDMLALIAHCLQKAKELAELINCGLIQVEPLKIDNRLPCEFCDYKNICFIDKEFREIENINFATLMERIHEKS